MEDGFGIAAGAVLMAGLLQGGTEVGVIEDFAVIGDPQCAVFVGHGLVAPDDIDDAEAAVAQGGEGIAVVAGAVGAAMTEDVRHASEQRVGRGGGGASYESCDTTHIRKRQAEGLPYMNSHTRREARTFHLDGWPAQPAIDWSSSTILCMSGGGGAGHRGN